MRSRLCGRLRVGPLRFVRFLEFAAAEKPGRIIRSCETTRRNVHLVGGMPAYFLLANLRRNYASAKSTGGIPPAKSTHLESKSVQSVCA